MLIIEPQSAVELNFSLIAFLLFFLDLRVRPHLPRLLHTPMIRKTILFGPVVAALLVSLTPVFRIIVVLFAVSFISFLSQRLKVVEWIRSVSELHLPSLVFIFEKTSLELAQIDPRILIPLPMFRTRSIFGESERDRIGRKGVGSSVHDFKVDVFTFVFKTSFRGGVFSQFIVGCVDM